MALTLWTQESDLFLEEAFFAGLAIGRSVGEGHQSLVHERWSIWLSDFLYERWRGCAYWMKCWHSDSRSDPSKHYESSINHCTLLALPKIQCGLGNRNKVSWRIKRYYLYPLTTWPLRRSHYSFPHSPFCSPSTNEGSLWSRTLD